MAATIEERVAERWHVASRTVKRFHGETYPTGEANAEEIQAIYDALEELGVKLVDEIRDADTEGPDPDDRSIEIVRDELMDVIEERLKAWAVAVLEHREARKAAAA